MTQDQGAQSGGRGPAGDEPLVKVEVHGRVGLLTLNRPKALNALNNALIAELAAAMLAFDADEGIGAMVLTGSDKAFAAGADIAAMQPWSYAEVYKADYLGGDWEALRRIRKPVIAAVRGFALGGGCELAMQCDLIIAADTARFGQPEINLGIVPGYGGTQRLPRAVGKAKAMDLVLTGRFMSAEEAERAGLVSRVVPATSVTMARSIPARRFKSEDLPTLGSPASTTCKPVRSRLPCLALCARAAMSARNVSSRCCASVSRITSISSSGKSSVASTSIRSSINWATRAFTESENSPERERCAERTAPAVLASIRSAMASAWARSSLSLRKAR